MSPKERVRANIYKSLLEEEKKRNKTNPNRRKRYKKVYNIF